MRDGSLLLFDEQLALDLALLSHVVLAPSLAIDLPATLKLLFGPNIVPLLIPANQTVSDLLPSSSLSMTSPLSVQGIPVSFTLSSGAVVKPLVPSSVIRPPATLKPLFSLNIILFLTPAKETASGLLPSSSLSMTSPFLAQEITTPSIFLSGAVVEPSIPPATQSTSLTLLLNLAMEFPVQGENQRQSISVPVPLPSPTLDLLGRPANQSTIEPATNLDPDTPYLDSPHDKNIASLFKALAKDACNADEDIAPAGKKKTLAKDACDADEDVAPAGKKRTWGKVALLLDRDVALAEKKRTWEKEKLCPRKKMYPRKKRRHIKKTPSMVGSETHKTKLDSKEGLGFKVSNVNSIVRPASRLSNISSKAELGSGNREVEKSGDDSIVRICVALIDSFCVFFCLKTSSKIVNVVILKLLDIHLSVNFETILWTAKEGVVFKIGPNENNCNCSPTLLGLQG